jgi:hypothetical protein
MVMMSISIERKEELLDRADKFAKVLAIALKQIAPEGKPPSEAELRLAFDFFLEKRNFKDFKQLLQLELPKRTGKTRQYWRVVTQKLLPFLSSKYSEEEFAYFLGWIVRLLKYDFLLIRTSYWKLK